MKKFLLPILLLGVFTAKAQTSLLPTQGNFDFEGGTPTNAYWWFLGAGSGVTANFLWQTAEKHGGNAAYQLNITASTLADQWRLQVTSTYNESAATYPTVATGTSYTLRFWLKTNDGGGTVRFSNTGSSLWSADTPIIQGDWKLYSFTFTGNGTKFKPYLEFGKSTVGTYYIDDVALYETSALAVNDVTKSKLGVYPNPAKDVINLDEAIYADAKTINVYDTSGKKVISTQAAKTINVSTLPKGVYMLGTENGKSYKFIKN